MVELTLDAFIESLGDDVVRLRTRADGSVAFARAANGGRRHNFATLRKKRRSGQQVDIWYGNSWWGNGITVDVDLPDHEVRRQIAAAYRLAGR
jgi:hypothetical protein